MTWWVFSYLDNYRPPHGLAVLARTPERAHMFIRWSKTKPTRKLIYRNIRGLTKWCGYKYWWNGAHTHEQLQPGNTYEHLFGLIPLDPWDHVWYYLFSMMTAPPLEHQGPLIHVAPMPAGQPCYYVYLASRAKGIFRTITFSGPGPLQPYWHPDNEGLLSLAISQAVIDPFDPYHRRFLIAGPHLYVHFNITPFQPAVATIILTHTQALALTGAGDGNIVWVDPNSHHLGMLHVLWRTIPVPCSFWHLRTLDYGEHWTAHLIQANTGSPSAGNILAGIAQGASPYPAGDVVYAAFNLGLSDTPSLGRSIDQGATWTTLSGPDTARGQFRPTLYVDPSNQAVLYMGRHPYYPDLFRSQDHGDSWHEISQGMHIAISLWDTPYYGDIRAQPSNPNLGRAVEGFWTRRSRDFCASWEQFEHQEQDIRTHKFTDDNPNLLYLAKISSGSPPPPDLRPHVIFVSDDEGVTMHGKAGSNCHLPDGGGDSIPYNCGGAAADGILTIL